MTRSATLEVVEVAADHRRYILDCAHATTTVDLLGSYDEATVLRVLRDKHRTTCACGWVVRMPGGDS